MARLRLLDAGLLQESHDIVHMFSLSTRDPKEAAQDAEEGDETRNGEPSESAAERLIRMEGFVKHALSQARKRGIGNDSYKDGLVYEERKRVVAEFYAMATKTWRRCTRCKA
jgi:DNA-directed RNA polymerase I subunit RPA1